MDAYLTALAARDETALRRLVPPDFDSKQAIAEKLEKYARVDSTALRRDYAPNQITPNIVTVRISGDTPVFEDVVHVQRYGTSWYVQLGKLRGYTPGTTTNTRPPQ